MAKNLPIMQETWDHSLGQEDPLEKGMSTHSSILATILENSMDRGAWHFMRTQRVEHDQQFLHYTVRKKVFVIFLQLPVLFFYFESKKFMYEFVYLFTYFCEIRCIAGFFCWIQ